MNRRDFLASTAAIAGATVANAAAEKLKDVAPAPAESSSADSSILPAFAPLESA